MLGAVGSRDLKHESTVSMLGGGLTGNFRRRDHGFSPVQGRGMSTTGGTSAHLQ